MNILTRFHSWVAHPDRGEMCQSIMFEKNQTGLLIFGYGQTVYLFAPFTFQVINSEKMVFQFVENHAKSLEGYRYSFCQHTKTALRSYQLIHYEGTEDRFITPQNLKFSWKLIFHKSPYPEDMKFPHREITLPREFYGLKPDPSPRP